MSSSAAAAPAGASVTQQQANLKALQFVSMVQDILCKPGATGDAMARAALVLRPSQYDAIKIERAEALLCAYPRCANSLPKRSTRELVTDSFAAAQKHDAAADAPAGAAAGLAYHYSASQAANVARYCCSSCAEGSTAYRGTLRDESLLLRDLAVKGGTAPPATSGPAAARAAVATRSAPATHPIHQVPMERALQRAAEARAAEAKAAEAKAAEAKATETRATDTTAGSGGETAAESAGELAAAAAAAVAVAAASEKPKPKAAKKAAAAAAVEPVELGVKERSRPRAGAAAAASTATATVPKPEHEAEVPLGSAGTPAARAGPPRQRLRDGHASPRRATPASPAHAPSHTHAPAHPSAPAPESAPARAPASALANESTQPEEEDEDTYGDDDDDDDDDDAADGDQPSDDESGGGGGGAWSEWLDMSGDEEDDAPTQSVAQMEARLAARGRRRADDNHNDDNDDDAGWGGRSSARGADAGQGSLYKHLSPLGRVLNAVSQWTSEVSVEALRRPRTAAGTGACEEASGGGPFDEHLPPITLPDAPDARLTALKTILRPHLLAVLGVVRREKPHAPPVSAVLTFCDAFYGRFRKPLPPLTKDEWRLLAVALLVVIGRREAAVATAAHRPIASVWKLFPRDNEIVSVVEDCGFSIDDLKSVSQAIEDP